MVAERFQSTYLQICPQALVELRGPREKFVHPSVMYQHVKNVTTLFGMAEKGSWFVIVPHVFFKLFIRVVLHPCDAIWHRSHVITAKM